jgi:hypothetical protein
MQDFDVYRDLKYLALSHNTIFSELCLVFVAEILNARYTIYTKQNAGSEQRVPCKSKKRQSCQNKTRYQTEIVEFYRWPAKHTHIKN